MDICSECYSSPCRCDWLKNLEVQIGECTSGKLEDDLLNLVAIVREADRIIADFKYLDPYIDLSTYLKLRNGNK
jgi:hypothetical protein